jgi:two-component system, chemotaxis family, CheB/CheR fusion protein
LAKAPTIASDLEILLDYLKRSRGFDFTGYKRSMLERRIAQRMEATGVGGYIEYLDHLEVHPDEFAALFNTILINVTAFFRDAAAWRFVAEKVLPEMIERKGPDEPIRVWSAGCASGEEPYSIAILLAEALGESEYLRRVKIYATDVDEEAIDDARLASYPRKALEGAPRELMDRYFERGDQRCAFRTELRRTVIFGRNDLVQDAPISRIDLLVCRNTLMYFNVETQARVLARFHFALNPQGALFMGKSEMLIAHSTLFTPIDLKCRVFTKVVRATLRDRLLTMTGNGDLGDGSHDADGAVLTSALDAAPSAQVVFDREGALVAANQPARAMLSLGQADIGRPLKDLELSYRPVELRAHFERLLSDGRGVTLPSISLTSAGGERKIVDVQLTPLGPPEERRGVSVAYVDVTVHRRLEEELTTSKHELESAYEELQSSVEELETTNEELQSTNEELETTNEELQSTNEELETINEELQSTNEELETINDELRKRTLELNDVNGFLEAILTSLGVAVIVLDRSQVVQIWNAHSTDMWGLRPEEAEGQHLLALDVGLPIERLRTPIRACLNGSSPQEDVVLEAVNRRGRSLHCQVRIMPMRRQSEEITGAILVIDEAPPAEEEQTPRRSPPRRRTS